MCRTNVKDVFILPIFFLRLAEKTRPHLSEKDRMFRVGVMHREADSEVPVVFLHPTQKALWCRWNTIKVITLSIEDWGRGPQWWGGVQSLLFERVIPGRRCDC